MRITQVVTRTGDEGTTGLVGGGVRVSKACLRIEAGGAADELNAALGLARALLLEDTKTPPWEGKARIEAELLDLQNSLFTLGAELATPEAVFRPGMPRICGEHVAHLDAQLASLNAALPPLEEFVLPGGSPPAAALHLARTTCRRAERVVVALKESETIGEWIVPFLNRLSDLLFVMARCVGRSREEGEIRWRR